MQRERSALSLDTCCLLQACCCSWRQRTGSPKSRRKLGSQVTIRRSKTDQEAQGRTIAVPFGRTRHCPVAALKDWLVLVGCDEGPIFSFINKHGNLSCWRISGEAVSHVVKTRIAAVGYDPTLFSGHSLRAGFATSAAQAGASTHKIRQVTGHRSEASLARYIRDTDLFTDNAAARML